MAFDLLTIIGSICLGLGLFLLLHSYYKSVFIYDKESMLTFPTTVLRTEVDLTMLDPSGSRAHYRKLQQRRINMDGVHGYSLKRLAPMKSVGEVDERGSITDIKTSDNIEALPRPLPSGGVVIDVIFKGRPPARGEVKNVEFSCMFIDSFRQDTEFFTTRFLYPVEHHQATIHFHLERPAKEVWLTRTFLGETELVAVPGLLSVKKRSDRLIEEAVLVVRRPPLSSVYTIHWNW